jgi:hypothetical protein
MNTEFGTVYVHSDFFYEDRGRRHHKLYFGYNGPTDENRYSEIYLRIVDENNTPIIVRNSEHYIRFAIPLAGEAMDGRLYASAEYLDGGGSPRYRFEDGVFYVYANRTGSLRLIATNENEIRERVMAAINRIQVNSNGNGTDLGSFGSISSELDYINVTVDFKRVLQDVGVFDLLYASGDVDFYNAELQYILGRMFAQTDRLSIREINSDFVRNNYALPIEMFNTNVLELEADIFVNSPNKSMSLITSFGNLDVYSNFFTERTGGEQMNISEAILRFARDEYLRVQEHDEHSDEPVNSSPVIRFEVLNRDGDNVDAQNPSRSFLLAIPLDSEFMWCPYREQHFNAVEYICESDQERGILPRSFVSGENLYVYANRTGRFRLTITDNPQTKDRVLFLRDRGISPESVQRENQEVITRGEFWGALMDIHWMFGLSHPEADRRVIDLPANHPINRRVRVGQVLGEFYLSGYPGGDDDTMIFGSDNTMIRAYLFRMLAIFINGFDMEEIHGLKPFNPNVILPQNFASHWNGSTYAAYSFLRDIGFIPYSPNNSAYIDLNEPVTFQEAIDILFTLVTAQHFS